MADERTDRAEKLGLRLTKSTSASREADERLGDRSVFTLDADQCDAFVAVLDARPHPRLERLFREPSIFDPKT